MSVIAWDGKTIAADRSITFGEVKMIGNKLWEIPGGAIAVCGGSYSGMLVKNWWISGARKEEWPDIQKDKEAWSILVVANSKKGVIYYEQEPVGIEVGGIMAWGSGKEIAIGVMASGGSAVNAVEIACTYSPFCGFGCDFVNIY
jgi:ATP-dependent protease HslVU (ClpYQ) peptidase subunit